MTYKFPHISQVISAENVEYDNFTLYFQNRKYGVIVDSGNIEDALKEIEKWQI